MSGIERQLVEQGRAEDLAVAAGEPGGGDYPLLQAPLGARCTAQVVEALLRDAAAARIAALSLALGFTGLAVSEWLARRMRRTLGQA